MSEHHWIHKTWIVYNLDFVNMLFLCEVLRGKTPQVDFHTAVKWKNDQLPRKLEINQSCGASTKILLLLHPPSLNLIHRWVRSERQQPGGGSTTYCSWFWPQRPATYCAGCLTVSWQWWQHSARPTSLVLWPALCPHYWLRAALSLTLSSTYLWINRWVSNVGGWLISKWQAQFDRYNSFIYTVRKRQITTKILQISRREFNDKLKSRRTP